ncbi:regulatory YrvL family protein [Clostridium sp. 29_15]|uniref:regulatory YrvL family protein n=1 Tax=Clostridium sp. 29_15 TaxID=1896982 RepID=UPI000964F4D0|nr:regulatory YrvL family protein [Clostridium sp. 29_15]OKZ87035.1 MAG: hypothetical protein BHW04_06035 [Clostridium sp. 29_15]
MKEIWKRYKENIVIFLLCALLFLGILSIIALLCGVIMRMFGFEYESVGSIILFFVIATIISYPFSMIAMVLPKIFLSLGKVSKQMAILFYIILDTFATFYGLRVVDYFMQSVSATDISIAIVSLIIALFGINDVDKNKGID